MVKDYIMLNGKGTNQTLHDIQVCKGNNEYLYNNQDKQYLDLASGLWNVSLGYNSELNSNQLEGFRKILDKNIPYIDMTSYNTDIYNQASSNILSFVGNDNFNKVIFTNSGSETLELALKITNALKAGKKVLSFTESYHGTFYGGMSLSGLTKDVVANHNPNYHSNITMNLPTDEKEEKAFIKKLIEISDEIGAVFVEPIIGSGGIKFASIDFYNQLLQVCKKNNIFVVFDEVATGFYKTGKRFFFNQLNGVPDILCLSKSINNGILPAGSLLISEDIFHKLENTKVKHMSTQNGNVLCLSSIIETLEYYRKHETELLNNVQTIKNITQKLSKEYDVDIRNFGSITAIPVAANALQTILNILKERGIIVYRFSTTNQVGLTLYPHINIDLKVYQKTLKYIYKTVIKYGQH
ncbi:aminotransferase class III-fold pyridoxal phosphate-dependent enzyme [Staphylococcus saprophyticus]|uniref:aminotransferase class III-fold pyridoxal phosphate-dependent enzyme n=1 Tax=Staphylococcus saprophyticus TaxID=29385 RepID=UPI0028A2D205|nr:aminotransferase class III-fold pyridoxal phosphate-dependent enzyme [Staphylococcus saprophyticus]